MNAGSSSLKLRLLDGGDVVERSCDVTVGPAGIDTGALAGVLASWAAPDVVGHRVVHGGTRFAGPARIDGPVRQQLADLTDLAPLHQPKSLAALDAVAALLPDVPAVASFDTAFHTTIPAAAATYAVPREWRERWGVRRYGFHGLSHGYCSRRVTQLVGERPAGAGPVRAGPLRVVTCHLGAGASLAAVLDGHSVDTTMGFTPLEGLVMATRSGSVDPGLVLWLEEHEHLSPREVATALEHRSGLTALAGTGDMREIEAAVERGEPAAVLALDVFVHRLVGAVAAMAAAAGGLDALAFTGGVGENSPVVRGRAARALAFLGVTVDPSLDEAGLPRAGSPGGLVGHAEISAPGAAVRTFVVAAREDLQIAAEARRVLTT